MRMRFMSGLGFVAILAVAVPQPAVKAAGDSQRPAIAVRIKSISGLLEDAKFLAKLGGKEDEVDQASSYINNMSSDKGIAGLDPKKPIGVYGNLSDDLMNSRLVAMLPVVDSKTFLDFMANFNINSEKDDEGIYQIKAAALPIPIAIYVRFANGYGYVTVKSKAALAKDKLANPAKFFAADHPDTLSATFRIDQLPDSIKQIALAQFEMRISEDQEKTKPHETAAQKQLRIEAAKVVGEHVATLIKDGGKLDLAFNIDHDARQLVTHCSLAGIDNSVLKTELADLGNLVSRFGAWHNSTDALDFLLHVAIPDKLKKAFGDVVEEGMKKGLAKEKDESKRESGEKLIKAADATVKSGDLDLGFRMLAPDGDSHYTIVAGIKLTQGKKIDDAIQQIVGQLPDKDRKKITFNAEKIGDVNVHRLNVEQELDADARRTLGENPIYVAITDELAIVAAGPEAIKVITVALDSKAKAGPVIDLDMAVSRMAPAMAEHHDAETMAKIKKAMAEIFSDKNTGDRIHFSLAGGDVLGFEFSMDAAAARFMSYMDQFKEKSKKTKKAKKKDPDGDDD